MVKPLFLRGPPHRSRCGSQASAAVTALALAEVAEVAELAAVPAEAVATAAAWVARRAACSATCGGLPIVN